MNISIHHWMDMNADELRGDVAKTLSSFGIRGQALDSATVEVMTCVRKWRETKHHGMTMYQYGCRCEICKQANRVYKRQNHIQRRARSMA